MPAFLHMLFKSYFFSSILAIGLGDWESVVEKTYLYIFLKMYFGV